MRGMMGGMMEAGGTPPPAEVQEEDGEAANVSPEEQAQYDEFVDNGLKMIYSPKSLPSIMTRLKLRSKKDIGLSEKDQAKEALASTAVNIVKVLERQAKANQIKLSGDVLFHGGLAILEDLAHMATKAGIHAYSEDEINAAFERSMDIYRSMSAQDGTLDQESAKKDVQTLRAAEAAGTLEMFAPGISGAPRGKVEAEDEAPDQEEQET